MGEPVLHQGEWWFQHENGAWSRWDRATQGWIPFQTAYPSTPAYSSIGALSRWVMGVIAVDMLVSLVTAAIGLNQIATSSRLAGSDPEDFFPEITSRIAVFNLLNVVGLASGLLFVVWFHRAYQNLPTLRTPGRYATGWAIGAWLVPILNFFRPKQMADDIWRSSDPALPENPGNLWLAGKVAPLLHFWWAAWIAGTLAPVIAYPFAFATFDPNNPGVAFARFFGVFMVSAGIGRVVAGAFAIPVVKQMTERQEQRAVQLGVPRGT